MTPSGFPPLIHVHFVAVVGPSAIRALPSNVEVLQPMYSLITPCPECSYETKKEPQRKRESQVECPRCGAVHRGPDQVTVHGVTFSQGDEFRYDGELDGIIAGFTRYTTPDWPSDEYAWMAVVETGDRIGNWLLASIVASMEQDGGFELVKGGDDE